MTTVGEMEKLAHKHEIRFYRADKLVGTARLNCTEEQAREHGAKVLDHHGDRFEVELVKRVRHIVEYDRDLGIGSLEPESRPASE